MNLSRLKTFLVLADCLSFSETAERLYCTQPAVSLHIKTLEDEIGCKLFDRIGKKIYLNSQGTIFKPYAQQVLDVWEKAKSKLQAETSGDQGLLSFGASNFVGVYLLPILLNGFHTDYPQVNINMHIRSSMTLINKLENNQVEFLILSDQIKFDDNLYYAKTFYHDELALVVPKDHPLTKHKSLSFSTLNDYTLLWKPEHSATRIFLEQMLKNHHVNIDKMIEISSLEAIKQSVINHLGIAFISKSAIKMELEHGLLCEIKLPNLTIVRGIKYVVRKDKILSSTSKNFIQLLDLIAENENILESIKLWQSKHLIT